MMRASRALLVGLGLTLVVSHAGAAKYDCKYLLERTGELVERGELSDAFGGLAATFSGYHSPTGVCPWHTEAKSEPYCRDRSLTDPLEPMRPPPNREWNGVDLGHDLKQIFINRENYSACRDIFEGDRVLAVALSRMPPLTDEQRNKYESLSHFTVEFGPRGPGDSSTPFTQTQERMFAVFEQLGDWVYCARDRYQDFLGAHGRMFGYFDPVTRRTTLYNGVCSPRDLYGLEISFLPSAFSAILIGAHEFGHGIESVSGGEQRNRTRSEALATYFGTLMAECVSRRTDELTGLVDKALIAMKSTGRRPEGIADLDLEYGRCAVDHLTGWSKYFREVRSNTNGDKF